MKREYNDGTHTEITLFVGDEIEKTPAYGMRTLFVVGVQDTDTILAHAHNPVHGHIKHIYFGANQSFTPSNRTDWLKWTDMIHVCLEAGFWCTLDIEPRYIETMLEYGLTEKRRFIPQISVRIPYLTSLGYNATIKLDDIDFNATNPGVWCHDLQSLLTRETFTNWDQYGKDEIIK
ncbi:MAG: hypothetical protein ABFD07_15395 [Methanobacterium sp.]